MEIIVMNQNYDPATGGGDCTVDHNCVVLVNNNGSGCAFTCVWYGK